MGLYFVSRRVHAALARPGSLRAALHGTTVEASLSHCRSSVASPLTHIAFASAHCSVLLIRPRLPPRQREVLSAALGADVPFRFYEDFNDAVFIAAAAVSAAVILAQHRAAGRAEALAGGGSGGDEPSGAMAALAALRGTTPKRSTD